MLIFSEMILDNFLKYVDLMPFVTIPSVMWQVGEYELQGIYTSGEAFEHLVYSQVLLKHAE